MLWMYKNAPETARMNLATTQTARFDSLRKFGPETAETSCPVDSREQLHLGLFLKTCGNRIEHGTPVILEQVRSAFLLDVDGIDELV